MEESKLELEMGKTNEETTVEDFSSPTPAKTSELSRKQINQQLVQLSDKHKDLLEFFNSMTASLRLLGLRKRLATIQNVSRQVEVLTGRKFLAMHLAQIKYILPEALNIEKFLIHDEQTKCMVPTMKIGLLFDVVESHGEESPYLALSSLFSSRLKEFCLANPEDSDVPEAVLPKPFNKKIVAFKEEEPISNALSSLSEIQDISHFSPSFKKRFHQGAVATELEKTCLTSDTKPVSVANNVDESSIVLTDSSLEAGKSGCTPITLASSSNSIPAETPVHLIGPEMEKTCLHSDTKHVSVASKDDEKSISLSDSSFEAGKSECTPIKLASGNDGILVDTPVQSTPMRSVPPNTSVLTCEDENKSTLSQISKQTPSAVKKSLHFHGMEEDDSYKHESVGLSDLVPLIHQIFRSSNFCPITKEELVHKIIMFNCDADDRSKVETQMDHLEKLVPDWLSKKLAPSGDLLYNVKRAADLNSVCERINVI